MLCSAIYDDDGFSFYLRQATLLFLVYSLSYHSRTHIHTCDKSDTFWKSCKILLVFTFTCLRRLIFIYSKKKIKERKKRNVSFLILPVMCANSTISAPNTENAFTNSVNVATDSSLPSVLDIYVKYSSLYTYTLFNVRNSPYLWLKAIVLLQLYRREVEPSLQILVVPSRLSPLALYHQAVHILWDHSQQHHTIALSMSLFVWNEKDYLIIKYI